MINFVINGGAGDVAINYTNGANNVSDGTLALSFGAGVRGLFGVGGYRAHVCPANCKCAA